MRKHSNVAANTSLSSGIADNTTTIALASVSGWPVPGTGDTALAVIDSEIVEYTGISGTSLTGCTRGVDGTAAVSHSAGASVRHCGSMVDLEKPPFRPAYNTNYLVLPGVAITANSSLAISANYVYLMPFVVQEYCTLTGLYAEVQTPSAAGYKIRFFLYRLEDGWVLGESLYGGGTELPIDAAAVVSVTELSISLKPGRYAILHWTSGSCTLREARGNTIGSHVQTTLGSALVITSYRWSETYHATNAPAGGTPLIAGGGLYGYRVFPSLTLS